MTYTWVGKTQEQINTMDFNEEFVPPKPLEGKFPVQGKIKSRIKVPKVFDCGSQSTTVLDLYYYLMTDDEKAYLRKAGITKIRYKSHAHGVAVGKAFTEHLKRNYNRLKTQGLNPNKMMYLETCFGFTQGLPADPFYDDVLFDWMVPRISFDSPGLLFLMREGYRQLLSDKSRDYTRVEYFMASGTARGNRIVNVIDGRRVSQTPSKTQTIVQSGNVLYYANLHPATVQHYLKGIPKFEPTKVRGIVTIPTYLHFALMPMTRWIEHNLQGVFNYMPKQQRDISLQTLIQHPACALDQSGFDHNLSLLQLLTVMEESRFSSYAQLMLTQMTTSVQVGGRSVLMANGMSSGYPYTSILDSAINLAQLYCISRIA